MPEQVAKITAAMDAEYRAMVLLAAYGSLRFGELVRLRRHWVDVLHRVIHVEESAVELADGRVTFGLPKSAAGRRTVAIPAGLMAVLEDHLNDHVAPEPNALLFTSPEGHSLRRSKSRHRWDSTCEGAEVSGLRFHDLRGSGATWAATIGATVRELMSRFGHATPAMALRYQHATIDRDQAIADRLGALMQAVKQPGEDTAEVLAMGK